MGLNNIRMCFHFYFLYGLIRNFIKNYKCSYNTFKIDFGAMRKLYTSVKPLISNN